MTKVVEKYLLQDKVGSGQFGDVYKGRHLVTNEITAIKVLKLSKFNRVPKLQDVILNEIQTLKKLESKHIVKFIKMLKTSNHIYLVYEFCNGGNLETYLNQKQSLSELEAFVIFEQLLEAIKQTYSYNIIHRDVKPENILFNNGVIKLSDFGFCKRLKEENSMADSMVGSPMYMAPECLIGNPYNTKADIYSLGIVLYEMLFGFYPYDGQNIPDLIK